MPQLFAVAILTALLHLLGGCGQTGPLYLPEEAPPRGDPAPENREQADESP